MASTDSGRESLNLRVPAALKNRLVAYATAKGLTRNAAALVLLDQALSDVDDRR